MSKLGDVVHGGPVDADEVARVRDVLLFEGPEFRVRFIRFLCLLVLAAAIATFGLLADSVATVIGAMIVAPLMLPIMGLAFSISIGDRKAILSTISVGLLGILIAIAVGYLLSIPFVMLDPEANTQIISRTSPRLVDLLAALATGLAGAFATSRKDVSDTLPGVAIAISLVPPLANVGILLGADRPDLAMGSLLLFVTNYLAILLTGSAMFGLLGFPRAVLEGQSHKSRVAAITLVVVLSIVIVVPLAVSSFTVSVNTIAEQRGAEATKAWVAGTGYEFQSVKAEEGIVTATVLGEGKVPYTSELRDRLKGQLFNMKLAVRVVPERTYVVETK